MMKLLTKVAIKRISSEKGTKLVMRVKKRGVSDSRKIPLDCWMVSDQRIFEKDVMADQLRKQVDFLQKTSGVKSQGNMWYY